MGKQKKGQSTLEYIIVFTVIVAAILFASNTFIRGRITEIINHTTQQAVEAVDHVNFK